MDNLVNDNWDEIDLSDLEVEEGEGVEEPEADQPMEPETQETVEDTFTLKYMDEEKSVSREDIVPLAQKGMDYDRIRGKLTDAETRIKALEADAAELAERRERDHWLEEMAKKQGVTVDEMIDATRANVMSRETGQSLEVVRGIIANEREARKLALEREKLSSQKDKTSKMDDDINAFVAAYPDVKDPKSIPQEVWDEVHKGASLLSAYRDYENKQLRAELEKMKSEAEAKEQKQINKSRSTGSQSDHGSTKDIWDVLWNDGT